jgi:hypothetical protein
VKPNINSVEVHPQLSNSKHPVDGVGAGSLQPYPIMVEAIQGKQTQRQFAGDNR